MQSAALDQFYVEQDRSDVRRLAAHARAAGYGDAPECALKAIDTALSLLDRNAEEPLVADLLRWQGTILRERGQTSAAEPLFHQSWELASRISYDAGAAHALNCIGGLAQRRGNITTAANIVSDAVVLAERCGDRRLVGILQQNLGVLADIRGNASAALAHYSVGLRILESTDDADQLPGLLNNLGALYAKEGRHDDARAAFRRAVSIARARGNLAFEGAIEANRAELELLRDAVDDAYEPLTRAYDIASQRGDDLGRATALKLRGAYQRLCGRPIEATDTLRYALTLSAIGEDALLGAETLYQFGLALYVVGQRTSARASWQAALEAFERIAAREWVRRVQHRLSVGLTGRYY